MELGVVLSVKLLRLQHAPLPTQITPPSAQLCDSQWRIVPLVVGKYPTKALWQIVSPCPVGQCSGKIFDSEAERTASHFQVGQDVLFSLTATFHPPRRLRPMANSNLELGGADLRTAEQVPFESTWRRFIQFRIWSFCG